MDLGLAGQVVVVVGGTGLIGRAVARQLVSEGATVVLAARDAARLEATVHELEAAMCELEAATAGRRERDDADTPPVPAAVSGVVVDTTDAASVDALVAGVLEAHGRIDGVVVTAAPSARTLDASRDRDPAQILGALDGKALGFLRVAEAVLPHLVAAGSGRIVGVSGQNARLTASVTGAVRNQALITIAKVLADSVAGSGVGVNVVNPGIVADEVPREAPAKGSAGVSTPAQVAALITFLVSPAAAGVSGESIAVGHKVVGVAGT